MTTGQATFLPKGNRLLDSLAADEQERLATEVDEVQLKMKEQLCCAGDRIDSVYFPLSCVVSLLTRLEGTPGVEVATIGNEGLVGVSLSWGAAVLNPTELLQVQVPGRALRMDAQVFTARLAEDTALAAVVRRYTQAFFSQISQQVACNGLHSIEERCARWMLLTHDRVGADDFPLTQEFLAQMLGVRRASVSLVAGILQQAGFIRYQRGRVAVTDRPGLETASCECYPVLCEVFDRLIP
ncbi:MAG: transcriptional regulator, Crp/Fnr family [Acidimicrobiaceae bacterium]|nr:transcriptional regulator, Crp/Fnr family [Acidimicrobiaceae bacterium]